MRIPTPIIASKKKYHTQQTNKSYDKKIITEHFWNNFTTREFLFQMNYSIANDKSYKKKKKLEIIIFIAISTL